MATKKNTKISKTQIKHGAAEEMEHTSSKKQAKKIAIDHLKERSDYYIKLKKAGLAEAYTTGGLLTTGYDPNIVNVLPSLIAKANYSGDPTMRGAYDGNLNITAPIMNTVQASDGSQAGNWNGAPPPSIEEQTKSPLGVADYASLARFAPAVGSLINWMDKDNPVDINLKRQGAAERLIPKQVNQAMLDANLASSYGRGVGDIINASGGSGGAARANLQGLSLSSAKAKADAFSKLNLANINNQMQADQFNIGNQTQIDTRNTGISNQESIIRMQNELAAAAKKEADRNAFFNSLGQIGVEQFQGNVISSANSGYGVDVYGKSKYKSQGK